MDFGYWYAQSEKSSAVTEHYLIGSEIGRGPFSVVYEGVQLGLGKKWAIKHFVKKSIPKQQRPLDISVLFKPYHDNIVRLKEIYETPTEIWVVSELVGSPSLNLFDRFSQTENYSEKEISKAIRQVLRALKYLHQECDITHKNVKPRNILCTGENENFLVKLDNIGHSILFPDDMQVQSVCGTREFCAPEYFLGKPQSAASDMWAVGVITYTLLSGQNPFAAENPEDEYRLILGAKYNFDDPVWSTVTKNGKHFVRRLLQLNPAERMSVDEALKHFWISGGAARSTQLEESKLRFAKYTSERPQTDESWWVLRLPTLAPATLPAEEAQELEDVPYLDELAAEAAN